MIRYRAEIDGLRALAVVPVILFHSGISGFSGGYVGVDIFFVISGYLITSIITNELNAGCFSWLGFIERRARRILPALFLVMAACMPFAWAWMMPDQFREFARSLIAVSLFVSNYYFYSTSGYFDLAAEEKPLLHTWSLAVEEQFYLIFPLLLLGFWRFKRSWLVPSLIGLFAISLIATEFMWRYEPEANFFWAVGRIWELLAGVFCALFLAKHQARPNPWLAALGSLAIIVAILMFDDDTPIPSLLAILPVGGTVLIILFADPAAGVGRLLASRPFVAIGLISYSAYLWHQPLFAFARIRLETSPDPWLMLILSALALVLASLSYRLIERPFRRRTGFWQQRSRLFGFAFASGIAMIGTGLVLAESPLFDQQYRARLTGDQRHILARIDGMNDPGEIWQDDGGCRFRAENVDPEFTKRFTSCFEQMGPALVLLGDSHSIDLFYAFNPYLEGRFFATIAQSRCRPYRKRSFCHYEDFLGLLRTHPEMIERVIYHQSGAHLIQDPQGNDADKNLFQRRTVPAFSVNQTKLDGLFDYLNQLSNHAPLTWLGARIEPHFDNKRLIHNICAPSLFEIHPNSIAGFKRLDDLARAQSAQHPSIDYVSLVDLVEFDPRTDISDCDQLFWSDGDHWSPAGERRFGDRLKSVLE